jgi:NitT/TauT family transport system ATP-binding protein
VTAHITLAGVGHTFGSRHGGVTAVRDVSLEIEPGQVMTLLGPSGSGKTTILRIVAGLLEPTAGQVSVDGRPPAAARAAKRIGVVPQSPGLLAWRTVEQNARLLLDVNRRANPAERPDPIDLLERVGLADRRHALPHELSGGMQQRVALVRAFSLGAPILLMDEPFAALDEITRSEMRHLLAQLCEATGSTVLFVTHSIAEAVFLSDRVAVLSSHPGRIVDVIDIDLPRPRSAEVEERTEFFTIETALRRLLHEGTSR